MLDPWRFRIETKLNLLLRKADLTFELEKQEMATLTEVAALTADVKGAAESAAVAMDGIEAELIRVRDLLASGGDPAALDALITDLQSTKQTLADAIARNPA